MAQGKKSFQLYTEWEELFNELEDKDAGQLIKHIFSYVNDDNPISDNPIVRVSFIQIKQQFKRDLAKWRNVAERNKANGAKGGRPVTQIKPINPMGYLRNPKEPKKPDKVEVEVKVEEKVKVKEDNKFDIFWNLYNKKSSNRKMCQRKWSKLNETKRELIMNHLVSYVKSTPDKEFRKNAETYLNQEHWLNEILQVEKKGRFPNTYDKIFEQKLTGKDTQEYHTHLRSLGWTSNYHPVGGTTWRKKNN